MGARSKGKSGKRMFPILGIEIKFWAKIVKPDRFTKTLPVLQV
jgi:hypothetical protein